MNKNTDFLRLRQNQIQQRLDRRWQPVRDQPVLEKGNIHYEISGRCQAVGCGGIGLIQEVVETTGLRTAIDEKLSLLKRRQPYFESDHVLSMMLNLVAGGRCLDDLQRHRQNEAFLDAVGARRIPGASTAGDFLRRFDADSVEDLMEAMNRASANVWRGRPKSERRLATLDVDGTIVETGGECKEKMDISYDGRWGFGPLVVSLAATQEVLWTLNRPANRPSHDGAVPCIDRAIRWAKEQAGFSKVRLRGDTDFSLTTQFDRWTSAGVEFVFGMDAHPSFVRRAKALAASDWKPMRRRKPPPVRRRRPEKVKPCVVKERGFKKLRLIAEHVTELPYTPSKATGQYRLIVLRKRIRVTEGQLELEDQIRYFFYVTNIRVSRMSPTRVVRENNARCHQENLIEQLKNGVGATRLPVAEFYANWAYLIIGSLAWNVKAWCALLLPKSLGARDLLKMEYRRFLDEVVLLPAQILRHGRRLIFRLLQTNSRTPLLLFGARWLKRRRFA